jgi:hypothetical protein
MIDEQNENVVIEHFDSLDDALLEPMIRAFQDLGISARVLRDPPRSQGTQGGLAALDTLVRVVVKGLEAGGTAVAAMVAKEAYAALKRGFEALWKNLDHTSDPGYSKRFSMKLSAIWEFPDGSRLKLLLDPRSQPLDAQTALAQFLNIVKLKSEALHSHSKVDALGRQAAVGTGVETPFIPEPRDKVEIWVFNPRSNKLESVDPEVE